MSPGNGTGEGRVRGIGPQQDGDTLLTARADAVILIEVHRIISRSCFTERRLIGTIPVTVVGCPGQGKYCSSSSGLCARQGGPAAGIGFHNYAGFPNAVTVFINGQIGNIINRKGWGGIILSMDGESYIAAAPGHRDRFEIIMIDIPKHVLPASLINRLDKCGIIKCLRVRQGLAWQTDDQPKRQKV